MTNIASVVDVGTKETCDLEVDHPDHQFYLTNGILTSNSHAVAYAIDSFWCAWLMTYYEEQWMCSYLEAYSKSPEKRAKAFGEARALGYTIVPIDINQAALGWTVLPGKKLMPSMTSVKGVGDTAVEEIMSQRPYNSIEEMLWNEDGSWRPSKFNKKSMEALIKVGAFGSLDCIGPDKVFKSYKHMHNVLMGSYTEEVTRKRKGVVQTTEVTREHAALIRRSTKKDPHEGRKSFYTLARGMAELDGSEWDRRELAEFNAQYFGSVDVTQMFDPALILKLESKGFKHIEELELGDNELVWFVTVLATAKKGGKPTSGLKKKTKNGKEYVQAFVTGPIGKPLKVSVWGRKENRNVHI